MVYQQFYILAFIFGAVIGSFLNVVILRYNTGLTLGGRSKCFSCGRELTWTDLVPILSFLILRGKCRKCGSGISWQYPLVEFFTGLVFLALFAQLQENFFNFLLFGSGLASFLTLFLLPYIFYAVIWSLLIVIFVYDIRHTIIPDALVYAFSALGVAQLAFFWLHGQASWLDILAGPFLFLFFFSFWYVSDGRWMGFGDAKLGLGIGLFLGFSGGVSAVTFGFWVGAVVTLILLALKAIFSGGKSHLLIGSKKLTIHSEIPFAPFLIIGMALVFFFHINLAHVLLLQY